MAIHITNIQDEFTTGRQLRDFVGEPFRICLQQKSGVYISAITDRCVFPIAFGSYVYRIAGPNVSRLSRNPKRGEHHLFHLLRNAARFITSSRTHSVG